MNPNHVFTDPDLQELDRIWPLGQKLVVPDGGRVLVAGAYEGRYMDYICSRFEPGLVIGFEPQLVAATRARQRLEKHGESALVISEGIGVHDCMVTFESHGTDGCKVGSVDASRLQYLRGIDSVLFQFGPLDLFICNMESYEYALLPYLVGSDQIGRIKSLAVQFHCDNLACRDLMDRHYGAPTYSDFPTWMYWRS